MDRDPLKLLLVGGVRGRHGVFDKMLNRAVSEQAEGIVVVGNLFGRHAGPVDFLDHMTGRCETLGLPVWFVEGPDDPHGMLASRKDGKLSEWVTHLQRGAVWAWGGVSFLAAGGGVSLDVGREVRPGWWPQEALAPAEVESCVEVGRVDVLLAYDAPWGVSLPDRYKTVDFKGCDPAALVREVEHRKGLLRIVERTRPQQVVCGPAGRSKADLTMAGDRVQVNALGDPGQGDEGCELLDIRPVEHPALDALAGNGPAGEVRHPALD